MTRNEVPKIINCRYFLRVKNVGDLYNADLIKRFGTPVWNNSQDIDHLICTGSILSAANQNSLVCGAGLMFGDDIPKELLPEKVFALRGKLSKKALLDAGIKISRFVALGDPGLLAADIFPNYRAEKKEYRIGIIPHYVDLNLDLIRDAAKIDRVAILDPTSEPKHFLKELARCEIILSSSLHGLIFAQAFGIPHVWVEFSDLVAGGGFKFRDHFSLLKPSQKFPVQIESLEDIEYAARESKLRRFTGSLKRLKKALIAATNAHSATSERTFHESEFISFENSRNEKMPVFIISFNRRFELEACINSLLKQSLDLDLIIVDNGSDCVATLSFLDDLENRGVTVVRCEKIQSADELNKVGDVVRDYFRNFAEPVDYAVTDCDIVLSENQTNSLEIMRRCLSVFRDAECVGPMLTIRDIPKSYPLYNHVMNRHIEQFWSKMPETTRLFGFEDPIFYQYAPIDTTFAVHRAGEDFRRLKNGVRLYSPFEAKHLDWYKASESEFLMPQTDSELSHWASQSYLENTRDEKLKFEELHFVESGEVRQFDLNDTPGDSTE